MKNKIILFLTFFLTTMTMSFAQEDIKAIKKAAKKGDPVAQFKMGECFFKGEGEKQDYKKALEWYNKSAQQGNADACLQIAVCYEEGYGVEKSEQMGVEWERKAADLGHPIAQYYYGNSYYSGYGGITQDYAKAMQWYEKSANQGYGPAQARIAYGYLEGIGVKENKQLAAEFGKRAAEQGEALGQYVYGIALHDGFGGMQKDLAKAAVWQRRAAEQDYAPAMDALGDYYYAGEGVEQDYQKAVEWYRKAADKGNAWGMYHLAICYAYGQGVNENIPLAFQLFKTVAEEAKGNDVKCQAQYKLAYCYEYGKGTGKDYGKAKELYQTIAQTSEDDNLRSKALNDIGDIYWYGKGVSEEKGIAKKYYQESADLGNAKAFNNLGLCYQFGYGVEQDYDKAVEWYRKAADKDNQVAYKYLGYCYFEGIGVEQDYDKALEWYEKVDEFDVSEDIEKTKAKIEEQKRLKEEQERLQAEEEKMKEQGIKLDKSSFAVVHGSLSRQSKVDVLIFGAGGEGGMIKTNGNADLSFELYEYPLGDPLLKTAILTVDVDWISLGEDHNEPIDWSWSGRGINAVKDRDGNIAIMDGNKYVAGILIMDGNLCVQLVGDSNNHLTGLRQGMYLDDLARYIQKEIPGTRVVITNKVDNGLTQYLLLSYGERKVYEVTGDYHYAIHNNEPYFSFWFDKNKKLVKWFKLKSNNNRVIL